MRYEAIMWSQRKITCVAIYLKSPKIPFLLVIIGGTSIILKIRLPWCACNILIQHFLKKTTE